MVLTCADAQAIDGMESEIQKLMQGANRALGRLSAAMLFAMMALTFVDVIGRYVVNSPLLGAYELTEVLLALVVFGAVPLVTARNAHVTTALFDDRMGRGVKRVRDVSVGIFGSAVCAVLAWRLWEQAESAAQIGRKTPLLDVPIAPVIYFMAVMAAACVPLFIVAVHARRQAAPDPGRSAGAGT